MRGGHGKPKNARATIARLLRYVARYKLRLIFVALCMLLQTVASLCGSYLLAPIIDRITLAVNPAAEIKMSAMEQNADRIIGALADTPFIASLLTGAAQKVTFYVLSGVLVLACVYLIGLAATYLQARLMMTVSQSAIESIRNDLFVKMQRLPVRYFDSNSTGEVMSRYTNDVDNIDTMLSNSLTSIFSGVITLIGTFVFMITTNWILTLVTIAFIPIFAKGGGVRISGTVSQVLRQPSRRPWARSTATSRRASPGRRWSRCSTTRKTAWRSSSLLNDDMRDKQFKAQFFGGIMGPVMGNTSQISYSPSPWAWAACMMCTSGGSTPGGADRCSPTISRQFSMPDQPDLACR